jgi:hypothetical protein
MHELTINSLSSECFTDIAVAADMVPPLCPFDEYMQDDGFPFVLDFSMLPAIDTTLCF